MSKVKCPKLDGYSTGEDEEEAIPLLKRRKNAQDIFADKVREKVLNYCKRPCKDEKFVFFNYPLNAAKTKNLQIEFSTVNYSSPVMAIYNNNFGTKIVISSEDLILLSKCKAEGYFNNNQMLELSSSILEKTNSLYFKWICEITSTELWIGIPSLDNLVLNAPFYNHQINNFTNKQFINMLVDTVLRFKEYSTINEIRLDYSNLILLDTYYINVLLHLPIFVSTMLTCIKDLNGNK